MCGFIAAFGTATHELYGAALDSMQTRGPDDRGWWADEAVWLGHRRLSVIDTTESGHQPMTTEDGRYVIVFNGEIYNYIDLRNELESSNIFLKGKSDTEVLLKSLVKWGPENVLPRLDGIFAFAYWDNHLKRLVGARDRFGIKPLFYSERNPLIVASTLTPFWNIKGFPLRLNFRALRDYLAVRYIPAPLSILEGVMGLEPGCWFEWSLKDKRMIPHRYWDLPDPENKALDEEELIEQTEEALAKSVKRQLVSDVPLGAFLSGGIDSSLVVHYMAHSGANPIRTFSVRFPESGAYDESRYAREVAQKYDTEHYEFDWQEIDAELFMQSIQLLDQPLADEAFLATLALSRLTRKHVTVALSGDGGDELFGGYDRYLETEDIWPDHYIYRALRWMMQMNLLPGALIRRGLRGKDRVVYHNLFLGPYPNGRKAMVSLLNKSYSQRCHIDQTIEFWRKLVLRFNGKIDTDALMRADLWTYLSGNCLVKTDRASMAHSLEVRVPILGNPVVDLILPQPATVKINGGLKKLLLELSKRHLPQSVWDRSKHGFSVPVRKYLTGVWQKSCDQLIDNASEIAPFLDAQELHRRWEECKRGRGEVRVIYSLIVLLRWLSTHPMEFE